MKLSEIYTKAADLIEENGWVQYTLAAEPTFFGLYSKHIRFSDAHDKCRFCVMGSLIYAARLHLSDDLKVLNPLSKFLQGESIILWNDDEFRKKSEIIMALRLVSDFLQIQEMQIQEITPEV